MYCTQCGEQLTPGALFCGNCGWRVAAQSGWREEINQREARGLKLCTTCRSEIPLDATVCHRCDASQPRYDPNYWAPSTPPPSAAPVAISPAGYGASSVVGQIPVTVPAYQLASIGRRIAAYAIDVGVLVILAVIVVLALGIDPEDDSTQNQQILIYAALTLIYFTICEALTSQTVGKRLTRIRVATLNGQPISWGSSVVRNLLRIVDSLPALYIVGLIVMSRSDNLQRLGDKAADTVVIHNPQR